jgi:glyoxylate reductase
MKIVMTARLPAPARQLLEVDHQVVAPETGVLGREALLDEIAEAAGLVCLLSQAIDAPLIGLAPRLKVIANYAVGFNNIDLAAATARGIVVTNTPEVLTETTADLAFALLLAGARRLVEGDDMVRRGEFHGWGPELLLGADVHGATLGIVGFGRIGRAVARRGGGFAMRVLYTDPVAAGADAPAAERVGLEQLLEASDFVSLHCPLTAGTRHLIGAAELRRMRPEAFLINTARGPLVDEAALARALHQGWIAGAALDVYEQEPRVHPELVASPKVVLAPHVGSATVATRRRMAELCAESVRAVLAGRRPANVVNPEVYEGPVPLSAARGART